MLRTRCKGLCNSSPFIKFRSCGGFVDYEIYVFCSTCVAKYPRHLAGIRCPCCSYVFRTEPITGRFGSKCHVKKIRVV